jgi:hypothetical protein
MKALAFFSQFAPGYINHWFRLKGLEASHPNLQIDYFEVESKKWRPLKKDQGQRWIALGSLQGLDPEFDNWLKEEDILLETIPVDEIQKINPSARMHESPVWVWSLSSNAKFEWNRKLFSLSQTENPSLFLCQDAQALEKGALPGCSTFFSPVNPELHIEAIQRAKCVISDTWDPCLLAYALGKPTIKLKTDTTAECFNFSHSPIFELNCHEKLPSQIFEECKSSILSQTFSVGSLVASEEDQRFSEEAPINLCSVSDFSYLPFFLGFIENIKKVSKVPVSVSLLALDRESKRFINEKYGKHIQVYLLEDIWSQEEVTRIKSRPLGIQAYSSKARLLKTVFQKNPAPTFYCDSDVFFFDCPSHLLTTLDGGHTVLFPHWNDLFPQGRADGLYNAGMIGIQAGFEEFVDWWANQCLNNCDLDPAQGVVGDQAYLDFAPIYFDGVQIYRGKDHNVARWNMNTLGLKFSPTRKIINSEKVEVKTFHTAFIDSMGFFEFKYCWDQLITQMVGYPLQKSPVLSRNVMIQQQKYWLSLSRSLKLRDGVASLFQKASALERAIQESSVWFSAAVTRAVSGAVFLRKKFLFNK